MENSCNLEAIDDPSKLIGTAYFEFMAGPYKGRCWNYGSLFLDEESFGFVEPRFQAIVPGYDHYSFTELSVSHVEAIVASLKSFEAEVESATDTESLQLTAGFYYRDTKENFSAAFDSNRKKLLLLSQTIRKWLQKYGLERRQVVSLLGL